MCFYLPRHSASELLPSLLPLGGWWAEGDNSPSLGTRNKPSDLSEVTKLESGKTNSQTLLFIVGLAFVC
jgi:hypothetical protein